VPKLPDFAVVDTTVRPMTAIRQIVLAGFFDENWKLNESLGR